MSPNNNQLIWITGASSGLGYALARLYAKDGAKVIVSARSEDKLQGLAAAASEFAGSILPVPVDVTDNESVVAAATQIMAQWGIPDTVILNAGYYEPCSFEDTTLEHFEKTIDVNYRGVVRCLMAVLPSLFEKQSRAVVTSGGSDNGNATNRSHLVLVSSVAGYSGLPRAAAYGSTKAALTNLGESIKHECNVKNIDVTVVNPGFVKTPLTDLNDFPMPFIMELDDAAQAMYSGISSRKFEVNFPKRFTWILKFLRILPYPLYFAATKRLL